MGSEPEIKKFLAFEWLMFLLFGLFWCGVMFLPLFLTGAFHSKGHLGKVFLVMGGPYMAYLSCRSIFLLAKSVFRAYLISNFLFTSEREQQMADEWILFVLLVILWVIVVGGPLVYTGILIDKNAWPIGVLLIVTPYLLYCLFRFYLAHTKGRKTIRDTYLWQ